MGSPVRTGRFSRSLSAIANYCRWRILRLRSLQHMYGRSLSLLSTSNQLGWTGSRYRSPKHPDRAPLLEIDQNYDTTPALQRDECTSDCVNVFETGNHL